MNLGDPDLELVDPTPNIHSMFLHFDTLFFWTKLASRAVVRWSKRMYSCAGICSYDRGGLCDIALSEPLLKLRPRKDLVETLLHEMIHAYLFITDRDRDRDGHGPKFKSHMNRINQAAGLNISIYHDFHEEVQLYQTHWWRCNGPCQVRKPYFGIVRRSMNKAPGPTDYWWNSHTRNCGGTFVKIKEPEKPEKKKASPQPNVNNVPITKYINVTNNKINNNKKINNNNQTTKPILKESNTVPVKSNSILKYNNSSTVVVTKKNNIVFNPKATKPPVVFNGKGQTINGTIRTEATSVVETVRNVWANKQLSNTINTHSNVNNSKEKQLPKVNSPKSNSNKHKTEDTHIESPPTKIKKIDDYFKKTATSVLKDLYGQDFVINEVNSNKRLSVTPVESNLVDCPICNSKISDTEINKHLDECLNKDIIKNICEDNVDIKPVINIKIDPDGENNNKNIKPAKEKTIPLRLSDMKTEPNDEINLTNYPTIETTRVNVNKTTDINANIFNKKRQPEDKKPDAFITPKQEKNNLITSSTLDSKTPKIKIEPSSSKEFDNSISEQKCPCCDKLVTKPMDEHFDECLAFFDNNTTIPTEGPSTSFATETIVIEDDEFDETLTLNATGTKSPCPCCLKMIELEDMNDHLDICLS
ncbi:unnamed protein product [Euphydryas editha]|uniref:Protein with SprT-like domain at the N terminus n=1 Tax=Euphydryas editha TaxID=104508 RepID=A0AAU9VE88_EUPED|nr:unnamed protein product [Euphydryas editha]